MSKILILADSRGRNLAGLLNVNHNNMQLEVKCCPGASLGTLKSHLEGGTRKAVRADKYKLVIIFGGICSVTRLHYMPYKAAVVRYETLEEILQKYTAECKELLKVADGFSTPVVLAPIVGMDLIKYAGHSCEELYYMQRTVDEVIPRINTFIKKVNDERGLISPNISSCIHRCRGRGKGFRTHYKKLPDGCHPSEEVNAIWAQALINCCQLNLQK